VNRECDGECGCEGCGDCLGPVLELGEECQCFECGHWVSVAAVRDVGAFTSDRPEDYQCSW